MMTSRGYVGVARRGYGNYLQGTAEPFPRVSAPVAEIPSDLRGRKRWHLLRAVICSLRGYKCEACDSTCNLNLHHKTYENFGNESIDELELLCASCHRKRHNEEKMLDVQRARKIRWPKIGFYRA